MVRDSQAPKYFKSTLETITNDDESDLVSAHIHLTGIAPSGNKDIPYMIALVSLQGEKLLYLRQDRASVTLEDSLVKSYQIPSAKLNFTH